MSYAFSVLQAAVSMPAQAATIFNTGTAIVFVSAALVVLVGTVLASQALAVDAVAMLVRSTGRDSVDGEGALHTDVFRTTRAETEE